MKGDQIDREGWSVPLKYTRAARKRQNTFLQLLFSGVSEEDRQAMERVFSTLSQNLKKLPDTKEGGGKQG